MPATRVVSKELLPVMNVPLIQRAVAEAAMAGIREIILVTSPDKPLVEAHFQADVEMEARLEAWGQMHILQSLRAICPAGVSVVSVMQSEPRGLGDAIWHARKRVGNRPFAVMLPDDVIDMPAPGCMAAMVECYRQTGAGVLAVKEVPQALVSRYGIVDVQHDRVSSMVEKPDPKDSPGNQAVLGRYILPPAIFDALEQVEPGVNGEVQLTDAITRLLPTLPFTAWRMMGSHYDCGSRLGYAQANIAFALRDPEIGPVLYGWLKKELKSDL